MKSKIYFSLLILTVVFTFSCTTLKRYNSLEPSGTDNSLAGIDLFYLRLSPAEPENGNKTLWDLSADAQSQFIKILNARYPGNDEFLQAMSFRYLGEATPILPFDYISKDLRLIFSISKKRDYRTKHNHSGPELSPADRIEYLKVTLSIPEASGVRFIGWNMFSTEYGSIDIADVSFSRSMEIDASGLLSADKNGTVKEMSAGGKSSAARKEDQEIKYRYLKMNGRINNNEIEMEEEGTREIDLTGNIIADLSLRFEEFPEIITDISGLRDSSGRFNVPESLTIRQTNALIPRMESLKDTIYSELSMDYIFRNVLKGRKTFPEWDDRVRYYRGSVSKRIPLLVSNDYVPDFYCIGTDKGSDRRNIINLSSASGKDYNLIFRTYAEADAFYEWLSDYLMKYENRNKTVTIGGYRLKFRDSDLKSEIFTGFSIIPCYR